jgi:L-aspartate oxidase
MTTALQLRTFGLSVLIVTKAKVDEGSTKWAQGGIAAALGDGPHVGEGEFVDEGHITQEQPIYLTYSE